MGYKNIEAINTKDNLREKLEKEFERLHTFNNEIMPTGKEISSDGMHKTVNDNIRTMCEIAKILITDEAWE